MSEAKSPKKSLKRKSMASLPGEQLKVVVEQAEPTKAGPAFVNYPSVRPADHIPFQIYTKHPDSDLPITKQSTVLRGETDDVLFISHNRSGNMNRDLSKRDGPSKKRPDETIPEGSDCQYIPAIYDPSTSTIHLHPSAPLYLMSTQVKRLRTVNADDVEARAANWRAQRNALGETFGTRKAKSQIKAEERNKVDVGAMEGIKGHLLGSIAERQAVQAGPPELIPTPDMETTEPMQVYTRQALIQDEEWESISVSGLIKAEDDKARMALLPWRRGRWMEGKMRVVLAGSERKTNLRYIVYLASLHHLLSLAGSLSKLSLSEIQAKSRGVSQQVLNGLLTNFAQKSGKRYSITDKSRTKILTWICAISLVLDSGVTDVGRTASDLGLTDIKVANIYKSLGCTVDIPTPAEREASGMSLEEAKRHKKAVLKAPVKFPKPKTRAGPRR